ncbi:unnamed protein product [Closterium sp. Naga37s-1]|nr:unnamed protein product [Closterium sp. Naga37s-1]
MLDIAKIAAAAAGTAGAIATTTAPAATKQGTKHPRDGNLVGDIFSSPSTLLHCAPPARTADHKMCTPPTPSSAPRGCKRRLTPWDENDDAFSLPPGLPPTPISVLQSAQCLSASRAFPHLAPPPSPLLLEEVDSDSTCSSPVKPPLVPQNPQLSSQRMSSPAGAPAEDSRKRQRAQPSQVQRLEAEFRAAVAVQERSADGGKAQAAGQILVSAERQWQLAAELGLLPRQVSAWFQTRQLEWQAEQGEADLRKMRAAHAGLAEQCCEMRNDYELLKGDYAQMLLHIAKILNKITQIENLLNADESGAKARSPYVREEQVFQPHQTGTDRNRQQAERGDKRKGNVIEMAQKTAACAQIVMESPADGKPQWGAEAEQLVSASASADTIGSDGGAPHADLSSPQGGEGDLSGTFLDDFEELSGSLGGQQDFFEAATAAAEAPLREMGLGEAQAQGHPALQAHQAGRQQLGKAQQPLQTGAQHLGEVHYEDARLEEASGQGGEIGAGGKEAQVPYEMCGAGVDAELMGLFWGCGSDGDDIVMG